MSRTAGRSTRVAAARVAVVAAAALVAALLDSAASWAGRVPDLAWLEGDWLQCSRGEVVEERWLGPRAGVLVGVNLTSKGERASFEFLRIAPREDGSLAYFAQPGGAAPVAFALVRSSEHRAEFENPAHDFPQRVIYWRDGDVLHARIESLDGRRSLQWTLARRGPGPACTADGTTQPARRPAVPAQPSCRDAFTGVGPPVAPGACGAALACGS